MIEAERLEVLAYTTRAKRLRRTYQDMSEAERLAGALALLQRWWDWSDTTDGSWRIPQPAWKALAPLMKETYRLLEQAQQGQGYEEPFL